MIHHLQARVASWSIMTFGSERPPTAPLKHLLKEVQEAIDKPNDIVEYADCLLLLLDAAAKAGFNTETLIEESFHKLRICEGREWAEADADGVREHVRG